MFTQLLPVPHLVPAENPRNPVTTPDHSHKTTVHISCMDEKRGLHMFSIPPYTHSNNNRCTYSDLLITHSTRTCKHDNTGALYHCCDYMYNIYLYNR